MSNNQLDATYSFKLWYLQENNISKIAICVIVIQSKIILSEEITVYINTHFVLLCNEGKYSLHKLNFDK